MNDYRLLGLGPTMVAVSAGLLLAVAAFWLYRRQLRHSDLGRTAWSLPAIRGLAVLLITLTLAEPTIQLRTTQGELARVAFLLDASQSMSIRDDEIPGRSAAPDVGSGSDRFQRGLALLRGPEGILAALRDQFELSVLRFDRQPGVELWNNRTGPPADSPELGYDWSPAVWGAETAIGDAIYSIADPTTDISYADSSPATLMSVAKVDSAARPTDFQAGDAVVLFSDGLNTLGRDPASVAEQLSDRGVKIFTVGFDPLDPLSDLGLARLTIPERVYRSDTLSGTVTVSQHQAEGTPFQLQLLHQGQVVWQQELVAGAELQYEVPFSLPVAPLFDQRAAQLPAGTTVTNLPLKLTARLSVDSQLFNQSNDAVDGYTVVAAQKSRLLLLDGRSRWEVRYLHNMFSRDPSWQVDSVMISRAANVRQTTGDPSQRSAAATTGLGADRLPVSRSELFEYELIILGEVEAFLLPDEFQRWLREYVEMAGGGLIIIDGARQHLRDQQFAELHRLWPVRWTNNSPADQLATRVALPRTPQLATQGQSVAALQLNPSDAGASSQMWAALPPLEFVVDVEPLPGAEVLLEAVHAVDRIPLLVTRRYGAGRVLYSASDETWRWRYKLAEKVHSRLWLQLARYTMKTPLSLHSEYVSLDTGAASYSAGQAVNVRCQLRSVGDQPASGLTPSAVVTQAERIVSTWPMSEEHVAGSYAAAITNLPAGEYRLHVVAANFSDQALQLESSFSIVAPSSQEMQRLGCDEATLATLANRTGGKYLRESQAVELIDLLQPLVRGKIVTSTWQLWQSYGWFTAAMLLLTAEWIIRKRVGLI